MLVSGSPAERVLLAVRDPYTTSSVSVYCAARTSSGYVVGDAAYTFRGATIILDADDAIVSESYAVGSSSQWDKKANDALVVRDGYTRYRFVRAPLATCVSLEPTCGAAGIARHSREMHTATSASGHASCNVRACTRLTLRPSVWLVTVWLVRPVWCAAVHRTLKRRRTRAGSC